MHRNDTFNYRISFINMHRTEFKTCGMITVHNRRDVIGPMTKDVETAALLDSVMAGEGVKELDPRGANTTR